MIPHEKALVKRLENEPFVLFGINTDDDPDEYRKLCASEGVTWPNLFQGGTDGPVPSQWGVSGYPTIYVVDADGVIRFRDLRGEELDEAVMLLIAEAKGEAPKGGDPEDHEGHEEEHEGGVMPAVPLRPGGK
ncbi:MAG: TlpA family protein disulfide reductase [Planctomycetes bacterium]|nr:TlpA family protein disulfide reductase [Planctomycetota bacterium]